MNRLRVVFFGEPGSTFSQLHYAVLRRHCELLLWVASQDDRSWSDRRSPFMSARDWGERLQERASLEWQTFRHLRAPLILLGRVGCPIYISQGRDPAVAALLRELSPDLILSAGYRRILPGALLGCASLGAFNCHPSPLPRYAGCDPWFWLLREGEVESAVTVHRMVPQVDAGDIVRQKRFRIAPGMNYQQLYNLSSLRSALLLRRCLDMWANRVSQEQPQDAAQRTCFSAPREIDYCIDWTWPAHRILNLVRASSPSPGAWTATGGRRFRVFRMTPVPGRRTGPGTVVDTQRAGITVACSDGLIRIRSATNGGKVLEGTRMAGDLRISVGDRLGTEPLTDAVGIHAPDSAPAGVR